MYVSTGSGMSKIRRSIADSSIFLQAYSIGNGYLLAVVILAAQSPPVIWRVIFLIPSVFQLTV